VACAAKEFGDDSSVHRWFQHWCRLGVFKRIWALMVAACEQRGQVHWNWQSADACQGKARHGGDKVGKNPTDRGKNGSKRSAIVDEQGGPLGVVIAGANRHEAKCSRPPSRPSWCHGPIQTNTSSICVWTKPTTTLRGNRPHKRASTSLLSYIPHIERINFPE
jgi:putative transposase